ncbi:MAG: ribosome biogenesis GTP-binding protein YihA/YsxC [Balneolales bacterium]
MPVTSSKFILSAPTLEHCPPPELPEVCFAGRSNVGKSSLINAITNRKKLAKTSNVPGKTREMNYFLINEKWYLVDLPGYGYARISKKESARWGEEIRRYLLKRDSLELIILIVDMRHKPTVLDEEFMLWLAENQLPFAVVLTKADKIAKTKRAKAVSDLRKLHAQMNMEVPVLTTSVTEKTGIAEVTGLIAEFVQPNHL